jgi:hypothetical protein
MSSTATEINEESKLMLARAFDAAWSRFLEREGAAADTDDNRKRLARRLVALAKAGELDEEQLGESGLIYLSVLAEAARLSAQPPQPQPEIAFDLVPNTPRTAVAGQMFGPDALAAMATALDLCLDELPLRIPSDVLSFLTDSIMAKAASGEHDATRLSRHALDALKAR